MSKTIRSRIYRINTYPFLTDPYASAHNARVTIYSNRLRRLMASRGETQYSLAEKTGVPQPTIQRILSGETRNPKIDTLQKLADQLGAELLLPQTTADRLVMARDSKSCSTSASTVNDRGATYRIDSPRIRAALDQIARAVENGTLTEPDLRLLAQLAERLKHKA